MNETELCKSLLGLLAVTPCPVTWGAAPIAPAGFLLLWDDRPESTWLRLHDAAEQAGEVIAGAAIEHGPHGRSIAGIILRPHEQDLDDAATHLRASYAIATSESRLRLVNGKRAP